MILTLKFFIFAVLSLRDGYAMCDGLFIDYILEEVAEKALAQLPKHVSVPRKPNLDGTPASHAPWCPACKDLHKAWNAFADWSKDLSVNVGEIDVTENPGLSGRFLITSLPSIFHVKDGVFRFYAGPRDTEDFTWFVEENKWRVIESLPAWKHPDSVQMAIVAKFFKLSMAVRDLHTQLIEKHGVPAWGSYTIFAGGTLLLGSILGVVIVHLIDIVFPNKPLAKENGAAHVSASEKKQRKKEKQKQQRNATKGESEKDKKSSDNDIQDSQTESQDSQSEGEHENDTRHKKTDKHIANGKSSPVPQKKK